MLYHDPMSPFLDHLQAERGRAAFVALAIGKSSAFVWQMATGTRPVPALHAGAIERATGLRRWQLRPNDWHQFWPDLIGTEGAPAVPAEKARDVA